MQKKILIFCSLIILFITGILLSQYVKSLYPFDKEQMGESFYIAEYVMHHIFIFLGIGIFSYASLQFFSKK